MRIDKAFESIEESVRMAKVAVLNGNSTLYNEQYKKIAHHLAEIQREMYERRTKYSEAMVDFKSMRVQNADGQWHERQGKVE